jgi:acyl-CoA thioester hydrolase
MKSCTLKKYKNWRVIYSFHYLYLHSLKIFTMEFKHTKKIQIRFGDIDLMGHANNGVQLSYLDLARMEYFKKVYGQVIDWNVAALIVAHLEIDYLSPIMLNDKIEVHTKIYKIGNKSVSLHQNIVDSKTGEIKTKTSQVMVAFSAKLGESIKVPETLKIRIREFEGEILA